jgi:hypothetical protein
VLGEWYDVVVFWSSAVRSGRKGRKATVLTGYRTFLRTKSQTCMDDNTNKRSPGHQIGGKS